MRIVKKSFSALDQFIFCERQFYYRRIAKKPEPPNFYFKVGNYYHDAAKALVLKQPHAPPEGYAEEIKQNMERLAKQIKHLDITHAEIWSNDINPESRFCAKLDAVSTVTPVVDDANQIVGSKPGPCVIDWKTIFGSKRRDQLEAIESPQLALYCLEAGTRAAAFVEIPRDIARPIRTLVVDYTQAELDYWLRYFNAQFEVMQQRGPKEESYRLAAYGEKFCSKKSCSFWDECPGGGGK